MTTVTTDRWPRVEEVFHAARDLPRDRRPAFVREACDGDPRLVREVESLLRSMDALDALDATSAAGARVGFLEGPASAHVDESTDGSDAGEWDESGRVIGPYRLIELLGTGGMGAVYLAEREDDAYRARVAIKIVKRGMDTAQVLHRFRTERQALANLSHPHIARLLDGGSLDDGRPYLVMELVEGRRIDAYCDELSLDVAARVRLFLEICAAVQHAHQNLIVHRDLKPSNILLTAGGDPKLLDFGIAKLLDPPAGRGLTELDPTGVKWMTFDYASPEQIRGESITTATDVYSLGVILYELLTGHRPHERGTRDRRAGTGTFGETPEKPSTVIARTIEVERHDGARESVTPDGVSRTREGTPDKLRRRLAGDLDNIVLTALQPDLERRYPSVELLSLDLARYLEGRPVSARRDTFAYRTSKFVRRNKLFAGAAALVATSLVLGLTGTLFHASRAARERDAAAAARAEAEEVTRFLVELFDVSDGRWGRGRDASAIDLLDHGSARIESELRDRPFVRASLMEAIGSIYRNLGAYDRAEPLLTGALDLREKHAPDDGIAIASILVNLGDLRRLQGKPADGLRLLERADEMRVALLGSDDPIVASGRNGIAVAYRMLGMPDLAEPLLLDALRVARLEPDRNATLLAATLSNLAAVEISRSRYENAERYAAEALATQERTFGVGHPDRATTLMTLGIARLKSGRIEEARDTFREAVRLRERAWGSEHPTTAVARSHLGAALHRLSDTAEAERLSREAVDVLRRAPAADAPFLSAAENNLAEILLEKGDVEEAATLYREALERLERSVGTNHPDFAGVLNNLGYIHETTGNLDEAVSIYRRVLAIDRDRLPAGHLHVFTSLFNLGRGLHAQGRLDEVEPLFREALEVLRVHHGNSSRETDWMRVQLGILLTDRADYENAERLLLEAEAAIRARSGETSAEHGSARDALARLYERWDRPEDAARWR